MDGIILEVMVAAGGHEGHLRITVTSEVVGHGGVHNMSGDLQEICSYLWIPGPCPAPWTHSKDQVCLFCMTKTCG